MPDLFDSYRLGALELPNRIVMAPMTRSRADVEGVPLPIVADYYAQRATAGLIVSEGIAVCPQARGYLLTPGLHSMAQAQAWRNVVARVHDAGGRIVAQLWHVGRVSHESVLPVGTQPLGPTDELAAGLETYAVGADGKPGVVGVSPPRAMTLKDIDCAVESFASAARAARDAGFDGVEILAGNGYLLDQFMNAVVNLRNDAYGGGCATDRVRLTLRVVEAVRNAVGSSELVGVRLSPFGRFNAMPADTQQTQTCLELAAALDRLHVDYVHFNDEPVSVGHLNEAAPDSDGVNMERLLPDGFIGEFRRHFAGSVIVCGALTARLAQQFLDDGSADLAAFGIAFIANPDLPDRLLHQWPLAAPRTEYFYGGAASGYTDYPSYNPAA